MRELDQSSASSNGSMLRHEGKTFHQKQSNHKNKTPYLAERIITYFLIVLFCFCFCFFQSLVQLKMGVCSNVTEVVLDCPKLEAFDCTDCILLQSIEWVTKK